VKLGFSRKGGVYKKKEAFQPLISGIRVGTNCFAAMRGKNSDTTNKSEFAPEVVTVPPVDISTERQASQTEEVSRISWCYEFSPIQKKEENKSPRHPSSD